MVWLVYGWSGNSHQAFFAKRFSKTITWTAFPLHLLLCVPLGIRQVFPRRLLAPSDFDNGQTILQRRCRQNVSRYRFATVPFTGRSLPRSLDSK